MTTTYTQPQPPSTLPVQLTTAQMLAVAILHRRGRLDWWLDFACEYERKMDDARDGMREAFGSQQ